MFHNQKQTYKSFENVTSLPEYSLGGSNKPFSEKKIMKRVGQNTNVYQNVTLQSASSTRWNVVKKFALKNYIQKLKIVHTWILGETYVSSVILQAKKVKFLSTLIAWGIQGYENTWVPYSVHVTCIELSLKMVHIVPGKLYKLS